MTHRVWIVAFACGLGAGLASGCALTHGHKDDAVLFADDKSKPPPDPPGGPSPYHAADDTRENRSSADAAGEMRKVGYAKDGPAGAALPQMVPDDPTEPRPIAPALPQPLFPLTADGVKSPPEEPVVKALLYLLDKRLPDAVHAIERYDKPTQEALLLLLPWVARFAEGGLDQAKPREIEKFLVQVEDFTRNLRPRAALTLGKVCFCRDVRGFGMIDPLPPGYTFQAGSDGRLGEWMILYVEVGNSSCRPAGQLYETRLAGKLDILDARDKRVWGDIFPAESNVSISPRHDYFIVFQFAVPVNLAPGRYTLVVELSDQTWHAAKDTPAHRTARQTLTFEVSAGDGVRSPARATAVASPSGSLR